MLYSIIVPVYKSEETLKLLASRVKKVFEELNADYEIIFVEDCGGGNSWEVLKDIKILYPHHITIIKLSRNVGQHNAIMCGFNHAKGNYIITMDDDLQCPPEEIPKLIAKIACQNNDFVYGIYTTKNHNKIRNWGSSWIKAIFSFVFNAKPDGSSFRIIQRSLLNKLVAHKQNNVFIDGLLHWHTTNIGYCEVTHEKRAVGNSTYTIDKLVELTMNLIFNFTILPLRIITYTGFLISFISFIFGCYFTYNKLIHNVPIGYTSLIVTVSFSTSIILMSLGVIGEYLSRIYLLQSQKPQYSIAELL
jgi:glycosyltransferase involved in cell wall biosynthesis